MKRGLKFAVQPNTRILVTGIPGPVDIFEIFSGFLKMFKQYSCNLI